MEDDGNRNRESPDQVSRREDGEKKKSGEGSVGPSARMKELIAIGCEEEDSLVYWESLLEQRTLHLLVVENDASVRVAITLLLRKCGYQVTVASNGLQAWKILKDLSNHFDLVLSEVDIPRLSGIDLLCNIMSHHSRKHIPVVMMSFRDSISLVFRCLSEGAVDCLLKPVRKNELKNLWLHIWRRWHRSCGSESENDAQADNYIKIKGIGNIDNNNTGSNNEDDSASFGLIAESGSDNASDTQSSWTKTVLEINSSQPVFPLDQMAEYPDSTCTFVMCSKSKVFVQEQVLTTVRRECQADEKQLGTSDSYADDGEFQASKRLLKISETNVSVTEEETPLHLRIKRLREAEDIRTTFQDDHHALSHFGIPVLSRYRRASNAHKAPCMNKGSSSPHDDYSSAVLRSDSATSKDKSSHPCPAFPYLGNKLLFNHQVVIIHKPDDMEVKETKPQPRASCQELLVQNLEDFHHHGHPVQNISEKLTPSHEEKMVGAAQQSGSSDYTFGCHVDDHTASSGSDGRTSHLNEEGHSHNLRNLTIPAGRRKVRKR